MTSVRLTEHRQRWPSLPLPLTDEPSRPVADAAICAKHGVRLNTRTDLSHAWRTAIARIFELSSPEATPKWAMQEPAEDTQRVWEHAPLVAYIGLPVATLLVLSPLF
jgi:hypothetical protein